MGSMSIDGLASGLNTTDLVSQLMQVEAIPQNQLKNRLSTTNQAITALQSINTKVASLAASAKALTEPKAWQTVRATSADSSIALTAAAGAGAANLSVSVTKLASAHSLAFPPLPGTPSDPTAQPPVLGLSRSGTDPKTGAAYPALEIKPASWDPKVVAAAINSADAGVTASAVQVSDGNFRLVVTAKATGALNQFELTGLGTASTLKQGADAEISLGGDLTLTSSSNTFAEVLPGVSLTVSKQVENVAVAVQPDSAGITSTVNSMVSTLNTVLSDIKFQTVVPATGSTLGGALAGNSTLRGLTQSLLSSSSGVVDGKTVASSGIEITREGTVKFDQEKFSKLLASDPEQAQKIVAGLAANVSRVADAASNSSGGSITGLITNRQSQAKDFTSQIEGWDRRLELKESTLKAQFSALELALSKMQSQSSWLAGQLAGLASSSS
jgi:flagellar hook-associated protein 2